MVDVGDEVTYWLPYLQWVFIISRWMGWWDQQCCLVMWNSALNFCLDAVRFKKNNFNWSMAQFSTWLGWLSLAVWRFWWLGSGLKLIRLDSFIAYWIVFEDHIQYSNYLIFKYTTKTFQLFHTNWYTVFLSPTFLRLVRRREHRYRKAQTKLQ